ncbi:MAG: NAD-dependent epimerase/dehydratase family protein, partial [Nitrospira sp.]
MDSLLITGAGGLVGSTAAESFHAQGYRIVGIDNDLRGKLLHDPLGSTAWNLDRLAKVLPRFRNHWEDVRNEAALSKVFQDDGKSFRAIIHCAAQTAHEGEIQEDFQINVQGTLNLLRLWRHYCPEAVFVYLSTIKVYGNYPNVLQYERSATRYDLPETHRYFRGFDETVSIDQGMSSFFGRSKTAADLYVQEYVYQFGLRAACFRASCLTGGMHSGTEAHGMLSYLMRCAQTKTHY